MIYFIKRETDLPFDNSIAECQIGSTVYDIIVQPKNSGLDSISDHIVNDTFMTFEKTNPREQSIIKEYIENKWGKMNELLLG